jgi:hypothetical protein
MRLALLCLPLAVAALTVPLDFDARYDPPLEVILGQTRLKFGLSLGGLGLGVSVRKRPRALKLLGGLVNLNLTLPILSSLLPKPDSGFGGKATLAAANVGADNEWSVGIDIGTPRQRLDVVLDSGSTDAFLYDASCHSCDLNNHTAFDGRRSSTFRNGTTAFADATFADGSTVTGYAANDTITLGGTIAIQGQLLGLVTRRSGFRAGATYDGIVGLGRDAQSFLFDAGAPSIFGSAVRQNLLAKPLVGVALRKAGPVNDVSGGGGEYNFGEINADLVAGSIVYTPCISKNAWGIALDDVRANGVSLLPASDVRRTLVDTGTTLIYVSDAVATALHALIPGAAFAASTSSWTVPCATSLATGAPNLFFTLAGAVFGIPASDLAFQGGWKTGTCLSGVQGGSPDFTILGDVFIKSASPQRAPECPLVADAFAQTTTSSSTLHRASRRA